MKALSIRQPWASLIAEGHKTMELRTRKTNYRGPLAIHASKQDSPTRVYRAIYKTFNVDLFNIDMPRGAIIAVVRLNAVISLDGLWYDNHLHSHMCDKRYFEPVKYGWVLTDIKRLDIPIPRKGQLGLWEWKP